MNVIILLTIRSLHPLSFKLLIAHLLRVRQGLAAWDANRKITYSSPSRSSLSGGETLPAIILIRVVKVRVLFTHEGEFHHSMSILGKGWALEALTQMFMQTFLLQHLFPSPPPLGPQIHKKHIATSADSHKVSIL